MNYQSSIFLRIKFITWLLLLKFNVIAQEKIMGFSDKHADAQIKWEKEFDLQLKESNLDTWMEFLTSRPHHLGSAKGKENAEYIAERYRSWGYETKIESYDVLFPTPKMRLLQLLGAEPYRAKLQEDILPRDRTSGQRAEQLPPYNAYSADGDVTAPLVFVNYGVPSDYEVLKNMGIDVKGKIVIAKYGGSWRGIKPKFAAQNGAIGCIIYSDPADDGYARGDVYDEGPFKPGSGVQRGSVIDMPVASGDPLTPGFASTKNAKRLDRKDVKTLMTIPVLPISYDDALPLLKSLRGPVAPASWRGALPITYHIGPGNANVHLKLEFNWDIKPLYNVIATLKGHEYPDEWVIRGNHHDAWVTGATDPISGLISQMEEARGISELVKKGYKPKRTLVYCAWDGEEQGLLGSVEWVEDHIEELRQKAVLYLNTDDNTRGFLQAGGSHSLEPFLNEIADQVMDPQTGVSIKERRYARLITSIDRLSVPGMMNKKYIRLAALGAGSDWGGFLQHTGITSMNLDFSGEGAGGEYHSVYDSYDHFKRFKDPGFHYGITLAKTTGRVMMRMADADVLPISIHSFYETAVQYAEEIKTVLENSRLVTDSENQLIDDRSFELAKDTAQPYLFPREKKEQVPYLNFSELDNVLALLKVSSEAFRQLYISAVDLTAAKQAELNSILFKVERKLLKPEGLPGRPWYRHQVYAPGLYTGYGVKTLPAIREGIEQRKWKEAQENISAVATSLKLYLDEVQKALVILRSAKNK